MGFGSSVSLTPVSGTVSTTTIYVRLNPTTATTYSANITNVSGTATQNVAVTGSSVPTITTTGTLASFSAAIGMNSAQQSYSVSGLRLTDAIVITPPAEFFVSTTSGSGYVSTLSLTPTAGVVSSTTIYVIFNRATSGTSSGNIAHTATGATPQNVAVSGTASAPTINATSSMAAFSSLINVASTEQTYTVAGAYLSGDITVTAPTGYQVSITSGSGFASSLVLPQVGGSVATATIYVHMLSAVSGTIAGNITHTSSGATTVNVAVTGTASLCGTTTLVTVADGYMSGANTTNNYGAQTYMRSHSIHQ